MSRMLEYVERLEAQHRATREGHLKDGRTYRSRFIAYENGYLQAIRDIRDTITLPERNRQVEETIRSFSERLTR